MKIEDENRKNKDSLFRKWYIEECNSGKTITEITIKINELIDKEFKNHTASLQSDFTFTKDLLCYFGLEEELIEILIKKGIGLTRNGRDPFLGGKFVSKRTVKELIRKIYSNPVLKN